MKWLLALIPAFCLLGLMLWYEKWHREQKPIVKRECMYSYTNNVSIETCSTKVECVMLNDNGNTMKICTYKE